MCVFLPDALQHRTTTAGAFPRPPRQPGFAEAALLYLDETPRRWASSWWGAGRPDGGEEEEEEGEEDGESSHGLAAVSRQLWAPCTPTRRHRGVGASPGHIAPPAPSQPGKTLAPAGHGMPEGLEAALRPRQKGFAFVSQPKLDWCRYRCALPLLPPWSTSTDKVTFLFYFFFIFFFKATSK